MAVIAGTSSGAAGRTVTADASDRQIARLGLLVDTGVRDGLLGDGPVDAFLEELCNESIARSALGDRPLGDPLRGELAIVQQAQVDQAGNGALDRLFLVPGRVESAAEFVLAAGAGNSGTFVFRAGGEVPPHPAVNHPRVVDCDDGAVAVEDRDLRWQRIENGAPESSARGGEARNSGRCGRSAETGAKIESSSSPALAGRRWPTTSGPAWARRCSTR